MYTLLDRVALIFLHIQDEIHILIRELNPFSVLVILYFLHVLHVSRLSVRLDISFNSQFSIFF